MSEQKENIKILTDEEIGRELFNLFLNLPIIDQDRFSLIGKRARNLTGADANPSLSQNLDLSSYWKGRADNAESALEAMRAQIEKQLNLPVASSEPISWIQGWNTALKMIAYTTGFGVVVDTSIHVVKR